MKSQDRLLVVLAHPDDESFIYGGTLAKISKNGGHPDHCAIGKAATLAFERTSKQNLFQAHLKKVFKPQSLYFVLWHAIYKDLTKENDLEGIMKVNISETLPQKIQALQSHRSQTMVFPELWNNPQPDLPFLEGNSTKVIEEIDFFRNII